MGRGPKGFRPFFVQLGCKARNDVSVSLLRDGQVFLCLFLIILAFIIDAVAKTTWSDNKQRMALGSLNRFCEFNLGTKLRQVGLGGRIKDVFVNVHPQQ